jgi:hypothetical protein
VTVSEVDEVALNAPTPARAAGMNQAQEAADTNGLLAAEVADVSLVPVAGEVGSVAA